MRWPWVFRARLEAALAEIKGLHHFVRQAGPRFTDVVEAHDAHRKALADALGEQKRHLNWDQLIAEVGSLRTAAAEWMAECEEHKARADALEKDPSRSEGCRLKRRIEHLERQLDDATKGGDQGTPIRKSWGLK